MHVVTCVYVEFLQLKAIPYLKRRSCVPWSGGEIKRQDDVHTPLRAQHERIWRIECQTSINHVEML